MFLMLFFFELHSLRIIKFDGRCAFLNLHGRAVGAWFAHLAKRRLISLDGICHGINALGTECFYLFDGRDGLDVLTET